MEKLIKVWKAILQSKVLVHSIEGHLNDGIFEFRIQHSDQIHKAWWNFPILYQTASDGSIKIKTRKNTSSIFVKNVSECDVNEFKANIRLDVFVHPDTDDATKKLISMIAPQEVAVPSIKSEGAQLLLSF